MTIEQIKAELTLATVLHYYHLKPDKNQRLNCPFHDDKTPSLQVYYKTHTCYCFSTNCKTHGKSLDVIDFIMYMEGYTKHEAIMKAKEMLNGSIQPVDSLTRAAVLTKMFTYFKNGVHNSKPAKAYIQGRGLDWQKLEIGYNSGQFHHGERKNKNLIESCVKYGLLLDKGHVNNRTGEKTYSPFGKFGIVFPLKNCHGQTVSLYFRSIKDVKGKNHYYLRDRQGLYPHYPQAETRKLILTEAIINAASLLQDDGISSEYEILSLYGTNGMTDEHEQAIERLKDLEEIILFFDGDKAGDEAIKKYAPQLKKLKPNAKITVVETPRDEDINSLLQGHSPEILYHFLSRRKPVLSIVEGKVNTDFFLSSEIQPRSELKSSETKEKSPENKNRLSGLPDQNGALNTEDPHNIKYTGSAADYYCKGGMRNGLDSLKVSLQIINRSTRYDYRAKLDLYEYARIESVATKAAEHLKLDEEGIKKDLMNLAQLLEKHRKKTRVKKNGYHKEKVQIPQATINQCLDFLKGKDLIKGLNELIGKCGITGEETNRIFLFGIALSYKMPDTLHALIQGSSGSGKSRLLKIICLLMPPEDVICFTRVTESSFYNYPENFLVHKLIGLEDMDGLKEEAQLAIRELISNEKLVSSTSSKTESGEIVAMAKTVRGPIASIACTTKGEIYEDNMSRVFLIAVDESREQTMRIVDYQQSRAAGIIKKKDEKKMIEFIQNVARLLASYEVINPYARKIKLPESAHKIRRLNELYLSFVKQVTLIHQYQREKDKQGRLITTVEDLRIANEIMFESIVLKVDELDGSLRQFFEKLKSYVKKSGKDEFILREIRQNIKVSKSQLHRFINDLMELEYLQIIGGHANRGYQYKISYWDDIEALRARIRKDLNYQIESLKKDDN